MYNFNLFRVTSFLYLIRYNINYRKNNNIHLTFKKSILKNKASTKVNMMIKIYLLRYLFIKYIKN